MTYSSVAVDRDGNWLNHQGGKDFACSMVCVQVLYLAHDETCPPTRWVVIHVGVCTLVWRVSPVCPGADTIKDN